MASASAMEYSRYVHGDTWHFNVPDRALMTAINIQLQSSSYFDDRLPCTTPTVERH
jgi:hypothetical protein